MSVVFGGPASRGKNTAALQYYLSLDQRGKIQAEYIWIGGSGNDLRSKTKTLNKPIKNIDELPEWNFDGSSTEQADGHYSEIWLKPIKFVPDPFRGNPNILVLCECLDAKTMTPIPTNKRSDAKKIFDHKDVKEEEPWYGIEQEYTLFESDGQTPLGWPRQGYPAPQGPYYCGIGTRRAYGRQICESHYRACLFAGLTISGTNGEVMPGQWEFQVGPCLGIDSGDQLWLARYILERIAEDFEICVSFDPKPIKGDWNGAGAHTNYSTKSMRIKTKDYEKKRAERIGNIKTESKSDEMDAANKVAKDLALNYSNNKVNNYLGYDSILSAIGKLSKKHLEHMELYGKNNKERLLGTHETARYDQFSFGVANRAASIRIPRQAELDGCGYFEDRRPAANCDPYQVTAKIAQTTLIE